MRIVHVDETFHPAYGYQANPLAKFQRRQGHEVYIVAPMKQWMYPVYREFGDDGSQLEQQDAAYEAASGVKIVRVPARGYFLRRLVYGGEVFRAVDELKPDVLMVHCLESLTAIRFLFREKYPMVFDSHMLEMASRNRFAKLYDGAMRLLVTPKIKRRGYDVIRTQDDPYVNEHFGIPREQTPFISFGTDTIQFAPSEQARRAFRQAHGIPENSFVVVYTGKLTPTKGGMLLAQTFREKFDRDVTLVCVGTPTDDDYGRQVRRTLEESANRVLLFPTHNYLELPQFYQMADLSVFPKQCSMSFYDAQSCGLPVLSEDNNINAERCSHHNGFNFRPDSVEDFRSRIAQAAAIPEEEWAVYRKNARAYVERDFDYEKIAKQYTFYLEKAAARARR